MRNTMLLAALATTTALLLPVKAAAQFEGVITIAIHDKQDGEMTMVQWTTANKFRMDMNQVSKKADGPGNATMILNHDAKTVTMVMRDQRMYMTSPMTAAKPRAAAKNGKEADVPGKLTRTGRTETVAGVSCDVYHSVTTERGKQQEGDICFGKGVGFMPAVMSGNGPMGEGIGALYAKIGAPLGAGIMKVTSYEKGKPHVDMEVTKVEKRTLSASDFLPPAGYKPFQMPRH
jgi:hypothetical protein